MGLHKVFYKMGSTQTSEAKWFSIVYQFLLMKLPWKKSKGGAHGTSDTCDFLIFICTATRSLSLKDYEQLYWTHLFAGCKLTSIHVNYCHVL